VTWYGCPPFRRGRAEQPTAIWRDIGELIASQTTAQGRRFRNGEAVTNNAMQFRGIG
jgi:hypothetical protein